MNKVGAFIKKLQYCLKFSWQASGFYTCIRIFTTILSPMLLIVSTYTLKFLTDRLYILNPENTERLMAEVLFFCLMIALIKILQLLSRNLDSYISTAHRDLLNYKVSSLTLERAVDADLAMYDNPQYYDSLMAARRDSSVMQSIVWLTLQCLSDLISFFSAFILLGRQNIFFALLMLVIVVPSSFAGKKFMEILYEYDLKQLNSLRMQEYISRVGTDRAYAQEVRCFGLGSYLKEKYENIFKVMFLPKKQILKKRAGIYCFFNCLTEVAVLGISIQVCMNIVNGLATAGEYIWYLGILGQISVAMEQLVNDASSLYDSSLRIENVIKLDQVTFRTIESGHASIDRIQKIEFRKVFFRYVGNDSYILKNVSFKICENEKIALVGLNGAGKSTIIKLILRLYDVDEGVILINDINMI